MKRNMKRIISVLMAIVAIVVCMGIILMHIQEGLMQMEDIEIIITRVD